MPEKLFSFFLKYDFSLKQNIVSHFFSNAFIAIIAIIFVPFYIRYIGIEAYGLVGLAVSIQAVLSILDLGLSVTITRELAM